MVKMVGGGGFCGLGVRISGLFAELGLEKIG